VVIFAVLPWGVRVPDEHEPGHASSAPERPMLWRKALITTVIAAVIWLGVYFVVDSELISLRGP
jgi:predicted secreted protein